MDALATKQNGVHYTPPALAGFLARQIVSSSSKALLKSSGLSILDPACGDGELLVGLIKELREVTDAELEVCGFEIDRKAVKTAKSRLCETDCASVKIRAVDFLESELFEHETVFDIVIANPPYVRTQTLGGVRSQQLASRFNLIGRVDLYHAFAVGISHVMKSGGSVGLLTSNRFLSVKSGEAMRRLLKEEFDLQSIFDLGDTRLFEAAVLPAIVVGRKRQKQSPGNRKRSARFHRIYLKPETVESTDCGSNDARTPIELIESKSIGVVTTSNGRYLIERGELIANGVQGWALGNSKTRKWLKQIRSNQTCRFEDVAEIKVGIKTTADAVFVRNEWKSLGKGGPENKLLFPLITHHDADRWAIGPPQKTVLYPYDMVLQKRTVVDLKKYPRTRKYLNLHRERLESRKYVAESGRKWFEIWVPHQPADWANPKLVWPDISEQPKFFLDESGAIVNGDCYWIKLRSGVDSDWIYMMLAIGNSTVATTFYDTVFHNKLYAGRRRFMTQYVKEFPLPELDSKIGKRIVAAAKRLVAKPTLKGQAAIDSLVQEAFGF